MIDIEDILEMLLDVLFNLKTVTTLSTFLDAEDQDVRNSNVSSREVCISYYEERTQIRSIWKQ
jgi:hypothetical protein